MALTKVCDVNLEILNYLESDFDLVVSLSTLDKHNNQFMKTTVIYQELITLKKK